jgi:hypothetical protein
MAKIICDERPCDKDCFHPEWCSKGEVRCPNIDLCGNKSCMHYYPHAPVEHGEKSYQNCRDGITTYPLCGAYTTCKPCESEVK